jgi:dihydrofolate synthase/folylpolyglutamate synthase
MNFNQALSFLLSLGHETLTIKLGLHNTETLLAALGDPQKNFPAVQIAGTNGKGSTAVMLDSICRGAGIRTGLFTSPHLISITERIKIDGTQISENEFARHTSAVKERATELVARGALQTLPTFFEHLTAIALPAFSGARVELAILETGLGGRLDSTTAAKADVVAITPIAMDHEEYLGSTISDIAAEKAAIIRAGVRAVIAPQLPEALDVIYRRCEEVGVRPVVIGSQAQSRICNVSRDGQCEVTITTANDTYDAVRLGLRGRHQVDNALVAVALAEILRERGFNISTQTIVSGLQTATHRGRLELWNGSPPILFDGAHNPASAQALRNYLDEFVQRPLTMIFGAMKDKRLSKMAAPLFPRADQLILTEMDNLRAAKLEDLIDAVPASLDKKLKTVSNVNEALTTAQQITPPDGLICITGSLYLIGEAQSLLKSEVGRVAHQ